MPESTVISSSNYIFTIEQFSFFNVDFQFNKATSISLDIRMNLNSGELRMLNLSM